jgi:hypothetical protein
VRWSLISLGFLERLLATGKDIVHPHCLNQLGHEPRRTFDLNAWRDHGRLHMNDLRAEGELVRLDSVGGTMLLIRADVHRDGLIFPPFLYGTHNATVRSDNFWVQVEITSAGTIT